MPALPNVALHRANAPGLAPADLVTSRVAGLIGDLERQALCRTKKAKVVMHRSESSYCSAALLIGITLLGGCSHRIDPSVSKQAILERSLVSAIVPAGQSLPSWSVEERMARYHVPGLSIALIDDGQIAWAKGYGVTKASGTEAVSSSTLFQAASITKFVTAIGALRLVEEGKLDLNEDVNERLTSWKLPDNEYTEETPVSLRALLSHTAGVTVRGFPGYSPEQALPGLRQILDGEPPSNSPPIRVDAVPNRTYRYSGGGYMIVQQLMEDATGQSFTDLMQQEVLDRVPMRGSTFRQSLLSGAGEGAACGHGFDGTPIDHCGNVYPETAAAWLWSTPTDLARLGIALSDSLEGRATKILSQASAKVMLQKGLGDMGLGPGVHGEGDRLHFDHAGWTRGFRSYMVVYPHAGKGIVVMANANGAHELIDEIVRSAARTYQWPDFAPQRRKTAAIGPEVLDSHVGEYEVREHGFVLSVKREDDHLVVDTPRGSFYTFYPATDSEYFAIEDGSELTFTEGTEGTAPALRVWGMVGLRRVNR